MKKGGKSKTFKLNISFLRKQNVKQFFYPINFIFYFICYHTLSHALRACKTSWEILEELLTDLAKITPSRDSNKIRYGLKVFKFLTRASG